MTNSRLLALVFVLGITACGSKSDDTPTKGDDTPTKEDSALTYYDDVAPILQDHCLQCHQDGGIAPFRLDDFATAKAKAGAIAAETQARTMPPWLVTSDGSCGEFSGSLALSDEQIDTFSQWAKGGAK